MLAVIPQVVLPSERRRQSASELQGSAAASGSMRVSSVIFLKNEFKRIEVAAALALQIELG